MSKYKYSKKRSKKSPVSQDPVELLYRDLKNSKKKYWYLTKPSKVGVNYLHEKTLTIMINSINYLLNNKIDNRTLEYKALICSIPATGIEEDVLELLLLKYYKNYEVVKIMKYKLISLGMLARESELLERLYCVKVKDDIKDRLVNLLQTENYTYFNSENEVCVFVYEDRFVLYPTENTNVICNESKERTI